MPQRVIDAMPDGVVLAGPDGRVQLVNTEARRMLAPREDPEGRPLDEVLALSNNAGVGWTDFNDPYGGLPSRTAIPEQSWLLPDGTEVLVVARLHRPAPRAPIERVAVTVRSGRWRARLDRDRSDLVATVAHELRSPLTGVRGFVHALLNRWDKLNDDQKKLMLTTVGADADRLTRLIAELLDVARIDTGRLEIHPRPCDLAALGARVVDSMRQTTSRRVRFVAADTPLVRADPDKMVQVLTNLIENAVRHGDGEVEVRIGPDTGSAGGPGTGGPGTGGPGEEAAPSGPSASQVAVTVTDEGPGIPDELRRRVFTKFWTGAPGGGSGLGLYIVHGLVRGHGGTVRIGDRPSGGAAVTVTLPVAG